MKDNILSVRLENAEYDFLNRWARNTGVTVSEVVRMLLRQSMFTSTLYYNEQAQTYSTATTNSTIIFNSHVNS